MEPYITAPEKFKDYGKLSHKNIDDLEAGHRSIKVTGDLKEDPLDFVLWKPKKTVNRTGSLRGARVVRAGILSVLSCQKNIWVMRLTFMQAARI